jgi:hypothetical protein
MGCSAIREYDAEHIADHMLIIDDYDEWSADGFEVQKFKHVPTDPVKISTGGGFGATTTDLTIDMSGFTNVMTHPTLTVPSISSPLREALPTGFKWLAYVLDPLMFVMGTGMQMIFGYIKGVGEFLNDLIFGIFKDGWSYLVEAALTGMFSWALGNRGTVANWLTTMIVHEDFVLPIMEGVVTRSVTIADVVTYDPATKEFDFPGLSLPNLTDALNSKVPTPVRRKFMNTYWDGTPKDLWKVY